MAMHRFKSAYDNKFGRCTSTERKACLGCDAEGKRACLRMRKLMAEATANQRSPIKEPVSKGDERPYISRPHQGLRLYLTPHLDGMMRTYDYLVSWLKAGTNGSYLIASRTAAQHARARGLSKKVWHTHDNKVFHRETPRTEWMMAVVHAIGAWQYSEDVTERATAASRKKVRDGWFPGRAKLGYRNVQLTGADGRKSGRNGIIVATPEGRQLIRRMCEMRVELGYSLGRIAEAVKDEGLLRPLVEAGLIKPTFERAFNAERVRTALISPFYKGMMEMGGQVHAANHEAMLTEAEWDRLQATFGKRAPYQKRKHEGALSGFLRCGCCGCAMVFDPKTKKSGRTYRYYACSNMRRQHDKRPRTTEEKLFEMFAPMADAIQIDEAGAQQLADALNELERNAQSAHHAEVRSFKAELVGLEDREGELYRDLKLGLLSETAYHRQLERVRVDRRRYTDLLAQAQSGITSTCLVTAQKVIELATNAKSLWMSLDSHDRRKMLEEVVSNPTFDGASVSYDIKKPFKILSEMRETGKWRAIEDSNL